jgi:sulfoxide reductase catalytic subunit YedY
MHIVRKPAWHLPENRATPEKFYRRRSVLLAAAGIGASLTGGTVASLRLTPDHPADEVDPTAHLYPVPANARFGAPGPLTAERHVTTYNNFYEFGHDKKIWHKAQKLPIRPWTIRVGGLVEQPFEIGIDDLLDRMPLEERVFRHRCVEGWSMIIPWVGFPLSALIKQAEPLPGAKFVAFQTVLAPDQMPNQKRDVLEWPYVEGLRMDEAMHPLAILAVGLYDEVLPNVDGAPLRLVVPWKYGFKGIKAIVKISFTDSMPPTTWNRMAPGEYGFYSNVNPQKDHPRWSQANERRIGEFRKRPTLMFNGYADQVASLYSGLDLQKNY